MSAQFPDYRKVELADDTGPIWSGTFAAFCRDNALEEDEAEDIRDILAQGIPYQFGGGAQAEFTLYPNVAP